MVRSRWSGKRKRGEGQPRSASVHRSPLSFDSSVLDNLGFFDFESLFPWDDSWRHLPGPSQFSLKGWFSGTVSTCWLEECQLYVKSQGRRTEVCSYTPTTQVAVVCLVVVVVGGQARVIIL